MTVTTARRPVTHSPAVRSGSRGARPFPTASARGGAAALRPAPSAPPLPRQLSAVPTDAVDEHADLGAAFRLAQAVRRVAVTPRLWRPAIRFETSGPYAVRVPGPKGVDVWLRTWLPGQHTGLVDLGGCATAFVVVQGSVDDVRADDVLGAWVTHLPAQSVRGIEPGVVHDLRGGPEGHTVTLHAYSPRLEAVTEHSWEGGRLRRVGTVRVAAPWQDPRVATA
jgi:hypothetical protein